MAAPALQMLTANRLTSGDVVYWHAGGWVEAFIDGDVFAEKEKAERALDAAGGIRRKKSGGQLPISSKCARMAARSGR